MIVMGNLNMDTGCLYNLGKKYMEEFMILFYWSTFLVISNSGYAPATCKCGGMSNRAEEAL